MINFKIAVAQIRSIKGDIKANTATHLAAMKVAAEHGVTYVVFPELSLTGYEPELAAELAFTVSDKRLTPLVEAARDYGVSVAVGVPVSALNKPYISQIIISPKGEMSCYRKMHLHSGEETFFDLGDAYSMVEFGGFNVANAICADTNHPEHAAACAALGADIYMAAVLISAQGYNADTAKLQNYATQHCVLVAMANHNHETGGWQPVGKSAIWSENGLLASASETENALVVAEHRTKGWRANVIAL